MPISERVRQHPLTAALDQADAELSTIPPEMYQSNPVLLQRLAPTFASLRTRLESADSQVLADQTLANFHSWTQAVVTASQNLRANPGNPQFTQEIQNNLDAIAQNLYQIPTQSDNTQMHVLLEEARNRLEAIQATEATARDRARSASDQIQSELAKAQEAAVDGLERTKNTTDQADQLLAELGAKGTSSSYLETAISEKKIADTWRGITLLAAIVAAGVGIVLLHDVHTNTISGVIGRASGSLPGLLITIYCGRQAAEHRHQERETRTLGLQLAGLSLFLADLNAEGRQIIKQGVADRIFGRNVASSPQTDSSGYPQTQRELIGLLSTVISKLR